MIVPLPNKRLKLAARASCGMTFLSAPQPGAIR